MKPLFGRGKGARSLHSYRINIWPGLAKHFRGTSFTEVEQHREGHQHQGFRNFGMVSAVILFNVWDSDDTPPERDSGLLRTSFFVNSGWHLQTRHFGLPLGRSLGWVVEEKGELALVSSLEWGFLYYIAFASNSSSSSCSLLFFGGVL